jgi:hypothetical protein
MFSVCVTRGEVRRGVARQAELCVVVWQDFELEMAFFVGPGNKLGHPISIAEVAANTSTHSLHAATARSKHCRADTPRYVAAAHAGRRELRRRG